MRRSAAIAAAILALAACSGAESVTAEPGSLLIHDAMGTVSTVSPVGADLVGLAAASAGVLRRQPTWSPDGSRVAWVEAGTFGNRLVVADPATGARIDTTLDTAPFFLQWSPAGDRLIGLGPDPGGDLMVLLVTLDGTTIESSLLTSGSPFYFDWSPGGETVLAHRGASEIVLLDVDGAQRSLAFSSGFFQAPDWEPSGRRAWVEAARSGDRLIVTDRSGDPDLEIVVNGFVALALDGDRLAYRVLSDADAQAAGFGRRVAIPNALVVLDLVTGEEEVVADDPPLAFEWSPDGSSLLFLTPAPGAGRDVVWQVWDGEDVASYTRFTATDLYLRSYLPFFDQYARSQTAWAPRSDAFAFAGTVDGTAGIWVQAVAGGSPVLVGSGDMVSWGR